MYCYTKTPFIFQAVSSHPHPLHFFFYSLVCEYTTPHVSVTLSNGMSYDMVKTMTCGTNDMFKKKEPHVMPFRHCRADMRRGV